MTTYTIQQREAHAEQAILLAAAGGWLPITSCTAICRTYGCPDFATELKRRKGQLFPEFLSNAETAK